MYTKCGGGSRGAVSVGWVTIAIRNIDGECQVLFNKFTSIHVEYGGIFLTVIGLVEGQTVRHSEIDKTQSLISSIQTDAMCNSTGRTWISNPRTGRR